MGIPDHYVGFGISEIFFGNPIVAPAKSAGRSQRLVGETQPQGEGTEASQNIESEAAPFRGRCRSERRGADLEGARAAAEDRSRGDNTHASPA